jgi:hypothetical protein
MLVFLVLAWWGLATVHCQIKTISELEILACHSTSSSPLVPPSHCEDHACLSVESGQYWSHPDRPFFVLDWDGISLACDFPWTTKCLGSDSVCLAVPAVSPPELAGTWQFSYRTALLPRAPSIAS